MLSSKMTAKQKKIFMIVVAAVALVITLVGIIFIAPNNDDKNTTTTTRPTTTVRPTTTTTKKPDTGTTAPKEHEHTLVDDDAVAPTCTKTGLTAGSHCSECGEVIVAQEEIPATGHTLVVICGKNATCTEDGWYQQAYCSVCHEGFESKNEEVIPATGHKHIEILQEAKELTCTEDGWTQSWRCTDCEFVQESVTLKSKYGHVIENGTCKNCDYTVENTLRIGSVDELIAFADSVKNGNYYAGWTIYLTADLDLAGSEFNGIGVNTVTYYAVDNAFCGIFEGNGHTIANMTVKSDVHDGQSTAGFFGRLGGTAIVRNINFVNANVSGYHYAGVVAGYMNGNTETAGIFDCTVENSTVTSSAEPINGKYDNGDKVGGIIGYVLNARVEKCTVTDTSLKAVRDIGGVVGCADGKASVKDCSAKNITITVDSTHINSDKTNCAPVVGRPNGSGDTASGNTDENVIISYHSCDDHRDKDGLCKVCDYYRISTAEDLFVFADMVNKGGNNFEGKKVVLENDIDLEGREWTPIGQTLATQFCGTFDGQNHTIRNLKTSALPEAGTVNYNYYGTGLFGWLNGNVRNLFIKDATVIGNHNVGAIAGYIESGVIEKCHVISSKITCYHSDSERCGDKAGAIVGYVNGAAAVKGCSAEKVEIIAGRDAGQIVGCAVSANTRVLDCKATDVSVTYGGDCEGDSAGANIRNEIWGRCKHAYDESGLCSCGDVDFKVLRIGSVEDFLAFADDVKNGNNYAGWTVYLVADIDLKDVTFNGIGIDTVTGFDGENAFCGTFDGKNHVIKNMTIENNCHDGYACAGFFTRLGGTAIVKNVEFNNAKVSGYHYAGVVAGYMYGSSDTAGIFNCTVVNSTVTSSAEEISEGVYDNGDKVGGIVGYICNARVDGCTVMETILTAVRDIGGIVGCADGTTSVTRCKVENVTIIADNELVNRHENYGRIIGRRNGDATIENDNYSDTVTFKSNDHVHTLETIKGYAATCTDDGLTDGEQCSVCKEWTTPQTKIPAKGHTETVVKGYDSTCWKTGLTDGVQCSVCKEWITSQTVIETLKDHDFENGECGKCVNYEHCKATVDNTLRIGSVDELIAFADSVKNGNYYVGWTIYLTADLDLAGSEFNGIGVNTVTYYAVDNAFCGTFDGNGHTISNMTVKSDIHDGQSTAGFFGRLGGTAVIKNINFVNANVSGHHYAGVVAGYMNGTSESAGIFNCTVTTSSVTSVAEIVDGVYDNGDKVGGIIGYVLNAKVDGCTVTDTALTAVRDIGGIVGCADGNASVTGCTVDESVLITVDGTYLDSPKNYNSIVGRPNGMGDVTTDNSGKAKIEIKAHIHSNDVDGYCKFCQCVRIETVEQLLNFAKLVNEGKMYRKVKVILLKDIDLEGVKWTPIGQSGTEFVGMFDGNGKTIKNLKINTTDKKDTALYKNYATGFFGWLSGTVKNLTFDNAVVAGNHCVGVVAGYMEFATVDNCTVKNSAVTGTHVNDDLCGDKVGAIAGYLNFNSAHAESIVKNCNVSNVNINAGRDAGQIVGCAVDSANTVLNCKADLVTVTADTEYCTGANIGGLVGRCVHVYKNGACGCGAIIEKTIRIGSVEELLDFAESVKAGNSYAGCTVYLTTDIDLEGVTFNGIGVNTVTGYSVENAFCGTFEGNGYTIVNMTIENDCQDGYGSSGFFTRLGGTAIVKNINFVSANVSSYHYAGVVAGYMNGTSEGAGIFNCKVLNSTVVSAAHYIGGIWDNGDKVGGIIGYVLNAKVDGCTVMETSLTAVRDVGGIVGCVDGKTYVTRCKVDESVVITVKEDKEHGYIIGRFTDKFVGTETSNTGEASVKYHNHNDYDPIILGAKAPDCEHTGLEEGKRCSYCGDIYVKQAVIPAKGHTGVSVPGKDATCTDTGLTDGEQCSVCKKWTIPQAEISAKGHTGVVVNGYDSTCWDTGLTDGVKCSVCEEWITSQTVIETLKNHDFENGECGKCVNYEHCKATVENTLRIGSAKELLLFALDVRSGNTYAGWTVYLTADIDLDGTTFSGIGANTVADYSVTNAFCGTFEGNNKTIKNMTIENKNCHDGHACAGFFNCLGGTAVVQNITFENANVSSHHYAGIVAGYMQGSSDTAGIFNCKVLNSTVVSAAELIDGDWDNGDKVGGIVGYILNAKVGSCSVESTRITGVRDIGGIAGYANGTASVTGCTVKSSSICADTSSLDGKTTGECGAYHNDSVVGHKGSGATVSNNTTSGNTVSVN